MAKEVLCKIDTYRDGHYYHANRTYTVPNEFEVDAKFSLLQENITSPAEAIEEKLKSNGIPRGVIEQLWLRRRCRTDEQRFEVLEEFLANQQRDFTHKQSKKAS